MLLPLLRVQTSLMLCVSYAASLHLLALTRAAHYFSFDEEHRAVRSVARAGVKGWWLCWWAMVWLWPCPVYFIPLLLVQRSSSDEAGDDVAGVSVTLLLWVVAVHAVVLTFAESVFAHMLTKTPMLDSGVGGGGDGDAAPGGDGDVDVVEEGA